MKFCADPFWNASLTWDTDNPNLTACFRNTVLAALPCATLWLSAPFWFRHLWHHKVPIL
jgi:hypothetical protein